MDDVPYYPIDTVAAKFCVSPTTIRAWVNSGVIPRSSYIKAGKTYRFNLRAVTRALMDGAEPDEKLGDAIEAAGKTVPKEKQSVRIDTDIPMFDLPPEEDA